VLRAFAARDLSPHLDPRRKVVAPGNVAFAPLHLTGAHLGGGLGTDQHATCRGRGLGEAGHDLDTQSTAGQGLESIEPAFIEVDGGPAAIDTNGFG